MIKTLDQLAAEEELIRREMLINAARRGQMLPFTTLTMPSYQVGWHHELTCKVLNLFIRKKIRRLILEEPPRHGKSELTSRRLPALWHGFYPMEEIMLATYNSDLAGDMTTDVQRIMDTPIYHEIFPLSKITPEGSVSKYSRNKHEHELMPLYDPKSGLELIRPTGSMRSAGVGGSFTGRGADLILIDDPIKNREDADSTTIRENVWKFYTSTLRTRLEGVGSVLITMTRWHSDDLVGRLLEQAKSDPTADQWVVLRLPAIKEDDDAPYDSRQIGEALWPDKFSVQSLMALKGSIGDRDWAALYQQRPNIEGGNIIKADWIQYYDVLPERFDVIIQSWDMATKDKQTSDFYVGQVWGRKGANKYLLDQVRGRWDFPRACEELIKLSIKWPQSYMKLIEAKANGPAVVQQLKSQVPGLVEVEPYGDKSARLNSVAPEYQAGNVWYPSPKIAPWVPHHVNELCSFPLVKNDDTVDAASQALVQFRTAGAVFAPTAGHSGATKK